MSAALQDPFGDPLWPADAIEVARIGEAWGVKGWFRVIAFAADPQAIFSSRRWYIKPAQDGVFSPLARQGVALPVSLRITGAKTHGESAVAHAQGFDERSAAQGLRGARVFIARSSFPTASDDEYYWVDLIGLPVFNRQGAHLGTVQGLIDNGPQSVLRVAPDGPAGVEPSSEPTERLIPFVAAYVDEVSLEDKRIVVDWELDY